MIREYDIFEKFPDGSSLWRASILGLAGTYFQLRRLAQNSGNQFYAIDMVNGKIIYPSVERGGVELLAPRKIGRRSKSAAA
jgi:hypothetical protein